VEKPGISPTAGTLLMYLNAGWVGLGHLHCWTLGNFRRWGEDSYIPGCNRGTYLGAEQMLIRFPAEKTCGPCRHCTNSSPQNHPFIYRSYGFICPAAVASGGPALRRVRFIEIQPGCVVGETWSQAEDPQQIYPRTICWCKAWRSQPILLTPTCSCYLAQGSPFNRQAYALAGLPVGDGTR
jgi:hypothetical protein